MKALKTAGLVSAMLAAIVVYTCLPARSAESTILYVRNQVYTAPTLRSGGDIWGSLNGLLKALRFSWKVQGNTVSLAPSGPAGPPLGAGPYAFTYRNKPIALATRDENGETWVSARSLAQAVGAGYQVNDELHIAEIYFVASAAAAPAPPVVVATPVAPAKPVSAAPAAVPAPGAATSGTPAEAASNEPPPVPSPTPQPDVAVSHSTVTPDWTNGKLNVSIDVENPADVAAKNVVVNVKVDSGEGQEIGTQTLYIDSMAAHQTVNRTFVVNHPDGTSMPRSLYTANCTVTFAR
ncbi:MAG TPA: hypothetical protein VGO93_28540 [Candidatus Xenobia bacterium]|jgi:hypothetical protein